MNIDADPEIRKSDKIDMRSKEGRALKAAQSAPQQTDAEARLAAAPQRAASRQAPQRAASRQAPRQAIQREPVRQPARNGIVTGRNGEVLSRKRTATGDIFDIPANMIEPGWSMQWCAVTVVGNSEILMDQNLMMAENGWRPVPAERFPGRFMPEGHKGSIIRGGQMLMERPMALTKQARDEDIRAAHQLISDRNDSLKLTSVKKNMGDGFEMGKRYRGTGGDVRISIDQALDVPAPAHQLAEPGE